ncbi:60S ribosomal protein L35 [Nowakowskiella sp. JEL0407]|nr:60S ribosomal protein L35 [Nowakowskiella sp. JEL0407]
MTKVKSYELREQSKSELAKQLEDLKQELSTLRVQKVSAGNASKVAKIHDVRKNIARVNTVISQTTRERLRVFYEGKKYIPLDLRAKKTRAIRRRLSAKDATRKTLKQKKRDQHFPQRKLEDLLGTLSLMKELESVEQCFPVLNEHKEELGVAGLLLNYELLILKHSCSADIATSKYLFLDASSNLYLARNALQNWETQFKPTGKKLELLLFLDRFISSLSQKIGIYFYNILSQKQQKYLSRSVKNTKTEKKAEKTLTNAISIISDFCVKSNATNVSLFYILSNDEPFTQEGYTCFEKDQTPLNNTSSFPIICGYPLPSPPIEHFPTINAALQEHPNLTALHGPTLYTENLKYNRRLRNFASENVFYRAFLVGMGGNAKERLSITQGNNVLAYFYDKVLKTTYFFARVDSRTVLTVVYVNKNVPMNDGATLDFADNFSLILNHSKALRVNM